MAHLWITYTKHTTKETHKKPKETLKGVDLRRIVLYPKTYIDIKYIIYHALCDVKIYSIISS